MIMPTRILIAPFRMLRSLRVFDPQTVIAERATWRSLCVAIKELEHASYAKDIV